MRTCSISVYNSNVPGITFDDEGVSNYAKNILWRLKHETFFDKPEVLDSKIENIKNASNSSQYDCVIGLSGGVDSSVVARLVIERGLRPLAVHLDNGWNTNLATKNIERIVNELNIDLKTYIVDWRDIKDLQRSYFKASVMDIECITDHAIDALLYQTAYEEKIKFVIHGGNVIGESGMPRGWSYDNRDSVNIKSIHKAYGETSLNNFPFMSPLKLAKYLYLAGIKSFPILNYVPYNKPQELIKLKEDFGWEAYGRKHGENRFTRFFQEYYLPTKFGIDKRIPHFSSLILSEQMDRESAVAELSKPLYQEIELKEDIAYVCKKLDFDVHEFTGLLDSNPRSHQDFKNVKWMFDHDNLLVQTARLIAKGEFSLSNIRRYREHDARR